MGVYKIPKKIIRKDNKPSFGAKINWHHPLSQELVGAWLFNEGGGGNFFNVIDGYTGTLNTCTWQRNGIYIADSTVYPNLPMVDYPYMAKIWQNTKPITVFGIWTRTNDTIGQNEGLLGYGLPEFNLCFGFYISNTNKYLSVYLSQSGAYQSSYDLITTTPVVNSVKFSACFKWVPSVDIYLYKDGKLIGQKGASPSSLKMPALEGLYWNNQYIPTIAIQTMPGWCELTYFYNRALTDPEIASLHTNPYQMFWHPIRDIYIVPAAAPPPTGGRSIFGYDSIFHAGGIIQT